MNELIVFPSAVAATITALNNQLASLGFTGVQAYGSVPKPRPARFVRVFRVGGQRDGLVVDDALLAVEAWAGYDKDAEDLAMAARAIVYAMQGTVIGDTSVYLVTESAGPANLPDPESAQSRFTFTVEVACRGYAA